MALTAAELNFVCDLVYKRSAIVLEGSKEYLIESRLGPVARTVGCASIEELLVWLRNQPANNDLQTQVVEAMTTNETTFFRDVHPFEALRHHIVPGLIKSRAMHRSMTIWCGASSTGQEPYSIAMLLREYFPELATWRVKIVATDLATQVLARAREGRYRQLEVNRGLPAPFLVKYFERAGADWQIKQDIRTMVDFRQMNLMDRTYPVGMADVVFLRNVLIYFDVETRRGILGRVRGAMAPDASLFLGGAETTMGIDDQFERVQLERAVCYRVAARRKSP